MKKLAAAPKFLALVGAVMFGVSAASFATNMDNQCHGGSVCGKDSQSLLKDKATQSKLLAEGEDNQQDNNKEDSED